MSKIQSVEPNIADLANGWLKTYKLDYKLEQESLNMEIDQALNDYYSKNGGVGGNRPDVKLLLRDKNLVNYPVLIEYKGYKDMFSASAKHIKKTILLNLSTSLLTDIREQTAKKRAATCVIPTMQKSDMPSLWTWCVSVNQS